MAADDRAPLLAYAYEVLSGNNGDLVDGKRVTRKTETDDHITLSLEGSDPITLDRLAEVTVERLLEAVTVVVSPEAQALLDAAPKDPDAEAAPGAEVEA